ncbi:hypothetical protein A3224_07635 [Microbulbifer thermotolerans]|uniref:Uncharacterized protein n=1 Tax=Microbulbifer thermotolerans TaxID=252514 RepID=A0A143HLA8_MICTH|nr:hypothetical protein A3224_07635 [Microbulbifer thermotolerans]
MGLAISLVLSNTLAGAQRERLCYLLGWGRARVSFETKCRFSSAHIIANKLLSFGDMEGSDCCLLCWGSLPVFIETNYLTGKFFKEPLINSLPDGKNSLELDEKLR